LSSLLSGFTTANATATPTAKSLAGKVASGSLAGIVAVGAGFVAFG